jgi:hypothetical protein
MTPNDVEKITADHKAALDRLEAAELKHKKANRWIITAILTAVATAGGSVGKHYLDLDAKRRALNVAINTQATDEARSSIRWEKLDETLTDIRKAIADCSTQGAVNAKAIEFLSRDQRWIMGAAEKRIVEDAPIPVRTRPMRLTDLEPSADRVTQNRGGTLVSFSIPTACRKVGGRLPLVRWRNCSTVIPKALARVVLLPFHLLA